MQPYIKDFMKSRNLDIHSIIGYNCEKCKKVRISDVHHITGSYRGKRTHKADGSDLIGVCRCCHECIHAKNTQDLRDTLIFRVKRILENINQF